MVTSTADTVDLYVATLEGERLAAIERLRAVCLEQLTGWEERMQWGMPGYGPPGEDARISFNSQKGYISIYPGKTAVDAFKDRFSGASFGKGCVRFARPEKIDFALVSEMLAAAYAAKGGACEG